ncbi:metalloprotease PmbA [Hydromonas duriensis]|uniref:Microcin-processing peptidase 1 n=1 Tax=Hydromonas duriensis TaxID=1527608 RepID=A0A4R6YBE7_9BURK|nr:metalloprotease PmbA [Hydromonas duriensis]TDR32845.1 microcin-processing peptidase 1 [Hydromonas duriensis]
MSVKFDYTHKQLETLAQLALDSAKKMGGTAAAVEVSESNGLSVSTRNCEVETVEHNRDKSLGITVYLGSRRGHSSTSDFSDNAVVSAVSAAFDIAKYTAEDAFAGLPAKKYLVAKQVAKQDLDLFHPWDVSTADAIALAQRAERAAFAESKLIKNTEGASVNTSQGHFVAAATNGFMGGFAYSRHSMGAMPIAQKGRFMERDAWFTSNRVPEKLSSPEAVGAYAAARAASRLGAKKISSRTCPVLFDAPLACGLVGNLAQAISGGALYRKTSFLLDGLGKRIFPKHIDVLDDPFVPQGMGSSYFDDEGVATQRRMLVDKGVLQGYLLSMYTARKLNMTPTGNASGSHNLRLSSRKTRAKDDLAAMLAKMGTGLFVTELLGSGVNYVTGDYSRGVCGFWVEGGVIAYPVQEITIAGNLKDMFKGIVAIGADELVRGTKQTGSILIDAMTIAG